MFENVIATVHSPPILQQAWTNDRGDVEWKDVPTWDEASQAWVG